MATKPAASKAAPKTTAKAAPKSAAKPAAAKPAASPRKAYVAKTATPAAPVSAEPKEIPMNEITEITESTAKVVAQVKVKELIDRVAKASGQNKKEARTIVEATLAELGKALEAGEVLNLPPLGKIRIANQKADAAGQMMTLKLRRGGEKKPGKNAGEALADPDEAS